jgi:hypothetical protein
MGVVVDITEIRVAPSLAANARKLERNMLADGLNQKLYSRSEREVLASSGLFKSENVAPRLRGAKERLQRAITRDQVGHLLESRPTQVCLYPHPSIPVVL